MNESKSEPRLFIKSSCSFCKKVLDYLEDMGKVITILDIRHHHDIKQELIKLTHKEEVPCLIVEHLPIYGSAEIILWLQEHAHTLKDSDRRNIL